MAAALACGVEEDLETVSRQLRAQQTSAQHEDVGVVVLTREPRRQAVMDECRADLAIAIGRDRHADPGTAYQHASARAPRANGLRHLLREIRIVDRIAAHCAEIDDLVTERAKLRHESAFQIEAAVIGSDDDRLGHGTRRGYGIAYDPTKSRGRLTAGYHSSRLPSRIAVLFFRELVARAPRKFAVAKS